MEISRYNCSKNQLDFYEIKQKQAKYNQQPKSQLFNWKITSCFSHFNILHTFDFYFQSLCKLLQSNLPTKYLLCLPGGATAPSVPLQIRLCRISVSKVHAIIYENMFRVIGVFRRGAGGAVAPPGRQKRYLVGKFDCKSKHWDWK